MYKLFVNLTPSSLSPASTFPSTQMHMKPDSLDAMPGQALAPRRPSSSNMARNSTQTNNLSSPVSSGVKIEYSPTPPYRTVTVTSSTHKNYSTSPPYRRLPTSNKVPLKYSQTTSILPALMQCTVLLCVVSLGGNLLSR